MKWNSFLLSLLFAFAIAHSAFAEKSESRNPELTFVPLPNGGEGIGFDDLAYSPELNRILIPGGRTGMLFLIDPSSPEKVTSIPGFSSQEKYHGGHGEGITSASVGGGFIFATDRTAKVLNVIDSYSQKIVASAPLASGPDYVRYIPVTNEVWVTEPHKAQIEIFSLSKAEKISVKHSAFISVPWGPESLIYDPKLERVYTHSWFHKTFAIDVKARNMVSKWKNGCEGTRGIALDEKLGFLFVGCKEGKVSLLDLNHDGKLLASLNAGSGIDIIGYNPSLRHLYLPGAKSATLAIVKVSEDGKLTLLREIKVEEHSHCVVSEPSGNVWVCDPDHGRLLHFKDAP